MLGVSTNVGSVDGKAGNDFSQRVPQTLQREIAGTAMLLGNPVQAARQHVELAGHRDLHDQALALVDEIRVALRPSRKLPVKPLEETGLGCVNEHSVEQIEEAVASGAFDGPARAKFFVADQNLFRCQVDTSTGTVSRAVGRSLVRQRSLGLKIFEVTREGRTGRRDGRCESPTPATSA